MNSNDPDSHLERYQPTLYSAGDTAQRLGVSVNMLRRYAKALEALQGKDAIYIDPQRGRLYTELQVGLLLQARDYIYVNRGSSVDDALRAVLGIEDTAPARMPTPPPSEAAIQHAVEAALRVALTQAVAPLEQRIKELTEVNRADTQPLLDEVKLLREQVEKQNNLIAELVEARALPPGATPERIDRALEVEMLESPGSVEKRQTVSEVVNSIEPQRREQESWVAAVALEAVAAASELPSGAREERRGGESTSAAPGEAQGSSDGPMVRAVRWLERWLYRRG